MRKITLFHLIFTLASIFFTPFSLEAQKVNGGDRITIGVITDCQYCDCEQSGPRHYRLSLDKLDSAIAVFNQREVESIFHLGDLIDRRFTSFDTILPRFSKAIAPVNFVLGNHEYMVDDQKKDSVYRRKGMRSPYYTRRIGNWKFIILNGDDLSYQAPMDKSRKAERDSINAILWTSFRCNMMPWNGGVGRVQMGWLLRELEDSQRNHEQVVVMCHFPVFPANCYNLWNDRQMVNLLSGFSCVKAYFNGHHHEGNYGYRNGIHFINFKAMVDTPQNSFSIVTLTPDSILIEGHGREESKQLKSEGGNLNHRTLSSRGNFAALSGKESASEIASIAALVTPSPRQLSWQYTEFNAFIHFGLNTFYNREWGEGDYLPSRFNPTELDARQWVRSFRDAGMKMVILTAKHHDGFCLWPSGFTDHSVAASPWRDGKGDLVAEVAGACHEYGLKFGIYLSPWDRHEPTYGDSPRYNEFFLNQLRELLTNYGEISEVWFDGACGEGANGKRQVYDWQAYYQLIRQLQPGAVIAVMGPDVRWVGTESGYGRATEWSVLPGTATDQERIAGASQQQVLDTHFTPGDLTADDLGSREKLLKATSLIWYPAETDVSIRPGWFWHAAENSRVKSPERLVDIYYHAVGMNSVLLLNVPPDTTGRIHENDIRSLSGMRRILDNTFDKNLIADASCIMRDSVIEYRFGKPVTFDVAMIGEDITLGQRIEGFRLEALTGKRWVGFADGTTVGYKRLLRFPEVTASRVRMVITGTRGRPELAQFGLFKAPPPQSGAKKPALQMKLERSYSQRYTGGGCYAIADGARGSADFEDHNWQGYEGSDFQVLIDLGEVKKVSRVTAGFLQDQERWIFLPEVIRCEVSDDGINFRSVVEVAGSPSGPSSTVGTRDFTLDLGTLSCRYMRIHATSLGKCPEWHPGAGKPCWLFVDEVMVE